MESGMPKSIMLWKPMNSVDVRNLSIVMFVCFWATLCLGLITAPLFNHSLDSVFFLGGGVFLGMSEIMYWIHRGLR